MKQRLGIAAALLGDPELLVLDEPTNGLDPVGISEMRDLIGGVAATDRTVLVSSHILAELEQVCDWLIVIDHGRGVFAGPVADFPAGVEPVIAVAPEHVGDVDLLGRLLAAEGYELQREDERFLLTVGDDDPRAAGRVREPPGARARAGPRRARAPPYQPAGPLPLPRRRRTVMMRSIRPELVKLTRQRFLTVTVVLTTLFAAVVTAVVVIAAEPAPPGGPAGPDRLLSISTLSAAGGGTGRRSPRRHRSALSPCWPSSSPRSEESSLGARSGRCCSSNPPAAASWPGKMVAIVGFATVLAVYAEAVAWVTARFVAPGQSIDTSRWTTVDALGAAAEDYGRLIVFIAGWAVLATMVGVLARSVPIGVGVGLVWAGPVENVIADGWTPGQQFFPGLVLRAIVSPAAAEISTSRALITLAAYTAPWPWPWLASRSPAET